MKINTLNFWGGFLIGFWAAKFGPEYIEKIKKKFIKEVKHDNQKSDADSGRVSDTDGSESDSNGLSKSQMQKIYDKLASMYQTDDKKDECVVKETPFIQYLDNNIDPNYAVECPVPDATSTPPKIIVSDGTKSIAIGKDYISSGSIKFEQPDDSKVLIHGIPIGSIDQSVLYGNYPTCVDPNTNKISFEADVTDTTD